MLKSEDNLIYKVTNWIARFVIGNVLWVIFSLPTILIYFGIISGNSLQQLAGLIVPLIISIPLFVFPATTALFGIIKDWLSKKENDKIIQDYWIYYKKNYKNSFLGGLIFTILWGFWLIGVIYLIDLNIILAAIYLSLGVMIYSSMMMFFSVLIYYDLGMLVSLKNAGIIILAGPLLIIFIVASSFTIIYISIYYVQILFVLGSASLTAFCSFYGFHKFYQNKVDNKNININRTDKFVK